MTQEDKQLLLADLNARLPHGVICDRLGQAKKLLSVSPYKVYCLEFDHDEYMPNKYKVEDIKPYLRPMSSMTEKEWREFSIFTGKTETYTQQIRLDADSMGNPTIGGYKCVYWSLFDKCIDWLNAHHFDYRGLIEKGLALEAPVDMYKNV